MYFIALGDGHRCMKCQRGFRWILRRFRIAQPKKMNPSLPRPVERVILGAREKDPRRRYYTVEDMLSAFQKALDAPASIGQLSSR